MSTADQIRNKLEELKAKLRHDETISGAVFDELIVATKELDDALFEMEKINEKQLDLDKIQTLYENARRLSLMLEEIKQSSETGCPSYIDDFVSCFAVAPYTIPRTLFEPQGAEHLSINVDGRLHSEKAELALSTLFPGSTTYRYGFASKVRTGRWFRSGRARLSSIHTLSAKPEFKLDSGGKLVSVYRPLLLNAFGMEGERAVCTTCLSLSDGDENCGHSTLQFRTKLPASYPVVRRVELSRKATEAKTMQKPFSLLVPKATFLNELQVGLAVVGFERITTARGLSRTVRIEYDPPIGIRLLTSGISFKVQIPELFEKELLQTFPTIKRDTIIEFLSHKLAEKMTEVGLPSYHHELLLSSIIAAIGIDNPIDEEITLTRLKSSKLLPEVILALERELVFYESGAPDTHLIERAVTSLQELELSENQIILELRKIILHSLAHVFLLGAAVTSGSELNDLDYLVNEKNDEVIIFDAVSGGNGSSEATFDFLSEGGKFIVKEYLESNVTEVYRPKNFDETAFEFLLPCINSIADRFFLFGRSEP